jgi:hypothetical protein
VVTARIFLLSPAHCGGSRARQLRSPRAASALAARLQSTAGAPIGDVFAFVSGLYFRGKLTYARRFAALPETANPVVGCGIHVITTNAGLRPPDWLVTTHDLDAFAAGDIAADNRTFTEPLARSARVLLREIGPDCDVVLLGSIASPKYVDVLVDVFGDRLRFPIEFIGRGDMSRGGLLLRKADEGVELVYAPVRGAVRRGTRPPKLEPLPRRAVLAKGPPGGVRG